MRLFNNILNFVSGAAVARAAAVKMHYCGESNMRLPPLLPSPHQNNSPSLQWNHFPQFYPFCSQFYLMTKVPMQNMIWKKVLNNVALTIPLYADLNSFESSAKKLICYKKVSKKHFYQL